MPRRDVLFLNGRTSYNRRNLSILVIFQQPEKYHNVVHDLEDFSDITEEIIDGNDDDVGGHIADVDDPIISIGFFEITGMLFYKIPFLFTICYLSFDNI